ncbi:hypothetical protein C8R43DRAFT_964037 [Mycena crocata]|nr:hypothetical protein C8R43DRAFT_964037 [Mycena crocata]
MSGMRRAYFQLDDAPVQLTQIQQIPQQSKSVFTRQHATFMLFRLGEFGNAFRDEGWMPPFKLKESGLSGADVQELPGSRLSSEYLVEEARYAHKYSQLPLREKVSSTNWPCATHIRLLRTIELEEWERPLSYTRRVRELTMDFFYGAFPPADVFEAICSSLPENMFPNIRMIKWAPAAAEGSMFPSITRFICPRTLNVTLECIEPTNFSLLPTLGLRYPELKSLKLDISSTNDFLIRRTLSRIAMQLEQIETLSLEDLD